MKYRNMIEKYKGLDLQLFAEDGGDDHGDDAGAGDDQDDSDESDEDGNDDLDEPKFTQKDVDETIKKRIARERRKWQRQQKKGSSDDGEKAGDDGNKDKGDKDTEELRKKAEKAEELELKWVCLEHEVKKNCVDDVLALAKVYMDKEDMDIEDAIDKVTEKYPQFKDGLEDDEDDESDSDQKKKGWGQRQQKKSKKTMTLGDEIKRELYGK